MSTFDPIPGKPYGTCSTCSLEIETEQASNEHMRQTLDDAMARAEQQPRSHRVRITNPPRAQRIRSRVAQIVDDATYQAMSDFDDILERDGVTEDEITEALRMFPDFAEAFEEHLR